VRNTLTGDEDGKRSPDTHYLAAQTHVVTYLYFSYTIQYVILIGFQFGTQQSVVIDASETAGQRRKLTVTTNDVTI
jgi:hypothetical protein